VEALVFQVVVTDLVLRCSGLPDFIAESRNTEIVLDGVPW